MPTLLIVDDESSIRYAMERGLRSEGMKIITAETAQSGIDAVNHHRPDVVVCDIRLPDMSGLDAFQKMRELDPHLPVIIITAHATTDTAIEAMKRGAFDYILKPYDLGELKEAIAKAAELSRISRVLTDFDQSASNEVSDPKVDRVIGNSRAMQQVYKEIGRVAPQNVNVLILGESGTGKELVARAIYQHSARSMKPFLAINCAAIPETLLESELFGHEKGAFTNADRRRIGKFEQADGGTLFLDEIGDMSLGAQAKVLRILQDGHFERVGGNETLYCDVRIIAATNNNLEQSILQKSFREDLFYRLNTFSIHLPPLRERLEDLPRLVEYFAQRFGRELGRSSLRISPECIASLSEHTWPGNVRELQSAIKYAIVRATSEIVTADCLPASVKPSTHVANPTATTEPSRNSSDLSDLRALIRNLLQAKASELHDVIHTEVDKVLYEEVLRHVGGHMTQATEILGISRTTFRTRLQQLGLAIGKTLKNADAE